MTWNITAECISIIILCIIWVYSRRGNPLPNLKNKVFQLCIVATFCSMLSNILATYLIYNYESFPAGLVWFANIIYFVATPLMGAVYFAYTVMFIYENAKDAKKVLIMSSIPTIIYLIFILTDPFTGLIFYFDEYGYQQGSFIWLTYLVFYCYCIFCIILVWIKRKAVDHSIRGILLSFPIIAGLVIIVQQQFPEHILSGSAATCALLIIYLYLQNKQISIDYLTGLPNRQEFLKMLEHKIRRQKDVPFTVLVLSLRSYRRINNKYGQHTGDLFLQNISAYLKKAVSKLLLYRFSGDEFAIIVDGADNSLSAELLSMLMKRMKGSWQAGSYHCVIPCAIGLAQYPESAKDRESLLEGLEHAVQRAKIDKYHGYSYCTQQMLCEIKRRNDVIELLTEWLQQDKFEIFYQPILSTKSNRFVLAESLLRMNQTPIGPIYPSEFIPIAEDTGLIIEITYQILNKVCAFVRELLDMGTLLEGISVNFSYIQFSQENLADQVFEIINRHKIPYSMIKIEITESILAENYKVVSKFIDDMHEKGILIGLDDFGTGYSNLTSVIDLSLDTIKLDRSLICASVENRESGIIVKNLSRTFHDIGKRTLAEGVETREQDQFVRECGCHFIQGYYYGKPMPKEEAKKVLGTKAAAFDR